MKKVILEIDNQNNSWILHREEVYTTQNGNCNIYFLLDARSGFCFGQVICTGLPPAFYIINLIKHAHIETGKWPTQILIDKIEPYVETLKSICQKFKINLNDLSSKDLKQFLNSFNKFRLKYPDVVMLP